MKILSFLVSNNLLKIYILQVTYSPKHINISYIPLGKKKPQEKINVLENKSDVRFCKEWAKTENNK